MVESKCSDVNHTFFFHSDENFYLAEQKPYHISIHGFNKSGYMEYFISRKYKEPIFIQPFNVIDSNNILQKYKKLFCFL